MCIILCYVFNELCHAFLFNIIFMQSFLDFFVHIDKHAYINPIFFSTILFIWFFPFEFVYYIFSLIHNKGYQFYLIPYSIYRYIYRFTKFYFISRVNYAKLIFSLFFLIIIWYWLTLHADLLYIANMYKYIYLYMCADTYV